MPVAVQVKRSGAWSAAVGYADVLRKQGGSWVVAEEMLLKTAGAWQQVWRKDGPPPDPTGVGASSANGGFNTISWTWPANVENDYNLAEVELSVSGGAWGSMVTTAYPTTSQVRSGAVNGTTYRYRVRLKDNGGNYSGWVETGDITGKNLAPSTPLVTVTAANWSAGNFNVNISNIVSAYSDVSNVSLYRRPAGGGAWTLVYSAAYSAASVTPSIAQVAYDAYHEFYATVTSPGGTSTSTTKSVWSRPAVGATKDLPALDNHTYSISNGVWRTDSYAVRQGRFDGTYGLNTGYWFHGTTLADACHGHAPASAQIFMVRNGSNGNTGPLDLISHGYATKPAGAPASNGSWTGINSYPGTDANGWEPIPGGLMPFIASGVVKSFGLYTASTSIVAYRVMRGPDTNAFAGLVQLTF